MLLEDSGGYLIGQSFSLMDAGKAASQNRTGEGCQPVLPLSQPLLAGGENGRASREERVRQVLEYVHDGGGGSRGCFDCEG